jgi:hypothetical protein
MGKEYIKKLSSGRRELEWLPIGESRFLVYPERKYRLNIFFRLN